MIVTRMMYESMCKVYGEPLVSRYFAPFSVVRR